MSLRLLILDDDETFRKRLARAMERLSYEVQTTDQLDGLSAILATFEPTHALLDLRLPQGSGLRAIPPIRRVNPQARIVLLSGYGSISDAVEALRLGADDFLVKPVQTSQIARALCGIPNAEVPPPAETPLSLARIEWEHMHQALRECGGNISEAARQLGILRRTLQRKLKKAPPPH